MRDATRDRVGKRMAIVLFEKGKPEVLSVATIQSELGALPDHRHGQRRKRHRTGAAAALRRAVGADGSHRRTHHRPALGAENIAKGFHSTLYGFIAIAVFMIAYYMLFGFFSVLALASTCCCWWPAVSMMQAPDPAGIAAIALALGMAIDANVLINERIREELRAALAAGGHRRRLRPRLGHHSRLQRHHADRRPGAAGLRFRPVRGFAVVHCLGILTSMFSAVFVSRGVVNLWYGRKKKLTTLSIGTVWVPGTS
jgi:preprotein translocase subunit SecD